MSPANGGHLNLKKSGGPPPPPDVVTTAASRYRHSYAEPHHMLSHPQPPHHHEMPHRASSSVSSGRVGIAAVHHYWTSTWHLCLPRQQWHNSSTRSKLHYGMTSDIIRHHVNDYRLDDRGSFPGRRNNFSLRHCIQTGSAVHPASYPMVPWPLLRG
jgi:hypothetical protein